MHVFFNICMYILNIHTNDGTMEDFFILNLNH